MKIQLIVLLICLCSAVVGFGETIIVPPGGAITVDGVEAEHEWDDAATLELIGGEYVRAKHNGQYLLLSIKGEKLGISSVAINTGSEVTILHASAGLITAVYGEEGDRWVQTEEFRSERQSLIRAEKNDAARMARTLELYGWCANILPPVAPADFDHQNITEFMISLEHLENGRSSMSVVFSQRTARIPMAHAPGGLADDSLYKPLVHGSNVKSLRFEPETWLRVKW